MASEDSCDQSSSRDTIFRIRQASLELRIATYAVTSGPGDLAQELLIREDVVSDSMMMFSDIVK